MPKKKRQHYVPKFYMRNFTDETETFNVYNVLQKKVIGRVPYDSQCYKDYFYGIDGVLENHLGEKESKWGVVFKSVLEGKQISMDDINLIKEFALYQRQRTLGEGNYRVQERTELLVEYAKMLYAHRGWKFDEAVKKVCQEYAKSDAVPAENVAVAQKLMPLIADLDLTIITYKTKKELISSDVPVIAINPFYPPSIGYSCMGLILLFPITGRKLAVLYDTKMYPKFRGQQYTESDNETEVHDLNVLQLISAEKILFANKDDEFNCFSEAEWNVRMINRTRDTVSKLGAGKNQLWITGLRSTNYDCEFSFGQVCHRFKRIPFICKEAPPRQQDSEWEDKLNIKADIMDQIAKIDGDILKRNEISRKELRKGCQRMASAAQVYWEQ